MPNLGLTAIAFNDVTKKADIDANTDIIDNAQSETFTADMTSGNVTLTNTEFREAIAIIGDNVTTTGRTLTIPNLQGAFLCIGDTGNTETFDLTKGSTTVAIAADEVAWFISGVGANDLERGGVLGAVSGTVQTPRSLLKVGFNGPDLSSAQSPALWNSPTGALSGASAPCPDTFIDDAGLDSDVSGSGIFEIPAGSGISMLKQSFNVINYDPNQGTAGFGVHQHRGENGGSTESELVFRERLGQSAHYAAFDRPNTFEGAHPPFNTQEGDKFQFKYFQKDGVPFQVQPIQERGSPHMQVEVVDAAPAGTKPEPIVSAYHSGVPTASAVISKHVISRPILLGDAFAGSDATVGTNPSGVTVFDICANGQKFGQVSFSTGGVPTFSYIADGALTGTNLGYEAGDLSGWTTIHGGGGNFSSANPRTGTYHFRCSGLVKQTGQSNAGLTLPANWNDLIDARMVSVRYTFWQWSNGSYTYTHGIQCRDTNSRALERIKWDPNPAWATNSTYTEQSFTMPVPANTREVDIYFECRRLGNGTGDLDDHEVNLTLQDVILHPGVVLEIVAPGTLNGIADIAITLKGRLV